MRTRASRIMPLKLTVLRHPPDKPGTPLGQIRTRHSKDLVTRKREGVFL